MQRGSVMSSTLRFFAVSGLIFLAGCAQIGSYFPSLGEYTTTASREIHDEMPNCVAKIAEQKAGQDIKLTACDELQGGYLDYQNFNLPSAEQKFKSAIDMYRSGDKSMADRDYRSAWFGLAASYDLQSKFKEADTAYQFILENFGKSLRYHNNYGYSLFLRKDKAGARREWTAALAIDPANKVLLDNMATLSDP